MFYGLDIEVPTLDGRLVRYVSLDNAASTPPLQRVQDTLSQFMLFYSSVHRGTGFKSQLSTRAYEESRLRIMGFFGADPATHVCIFGKNATEALNKLANRIQFPPGRDIVLTTAMEHHSNDLPWRKSAHTIHVSLTPDGRLDRRDLDRKLEIYKSRLALLSITGASNVTGTLNPIHEIAERVHELGAEIAVDCAQLAPHRQVDVRPLDDPSHLDYITISGHKMYAPYGTGALIGRRDTFERGDPDMVGGGTVEIVTLDDVVWAGPPDRDEAGSPNTAGAIALAAAIQELNRIGMDVIASHELDLTRYALDKMHSIPGIRIFGDPEALSSNDRLGVIPFNLEGISHFKVAAILGYEFGVGVRNGCFCAHPYILHLLGLTEEESNKVREDMLSGDKRHMPGLVRASFGLYNTFEEVDVLIAALSSILRGEYSGEYHQDPASGEYHPADFQFDLDSYFDV